MVQLQEETREDVAPLRKSQIIEIILGKAYGYSRGCGHGPKPNRRASSSSSSSTRLLQEELEATKEELATTRVLVAHQEKRIDWLTSMVSQLAGVPIPSTDDAQTIRPTTAATPATSSCDGAESLVSDGISKRLYASRLSRRLAGVRLYARIATHSFPSHHKTEVTATNRESCN